MKIKTHVYLKKSQHNKLFLNLQKKILLPKNPSQYDKGEISQKCSNAKRKQRRFIEPVFCSLIAKRQRGGLLQAKLTNKHNLPAFTHKVCFKILLIALVLKFVHNTFCFANSALITSSFSKSPTFLFKYFSIRCFLFIFCCTLLISPHLCVF